MSLLLKADFGFIQAVSFLSVILHIQFCFSRLNHTRVRYSVPLFFVFSFTCFFFFYSVAQLSYFDFFFCSFISTNLREHFIIFSSFFFYMQSFDPFHNELFWDYVFIFFSRTNSSFNVFWCTLPVFSCEIVFFITSFSFF